MSKDIPKIFYKSEAAILYEGDCLEVIDSLSERSIDMIFADPPYNLSNGGITSRDCNMGSQVREEQAQV